MARRLPAPCAPRRHRPGVGGPQKCAIIDAGLTGLVLRFHGAVAINLTGCSNVTPPDAQTCSTSTSAARAGT